ncbi:DUF3016 domain-containing protein [Paracoccus laeviglucosivorans]|uniref:DUF3016 domain-containing protein n=1 Tax=Paracoccus laeviglucosivorans TaxID=1197861 RepID=A0A521ETC7_9RHOB|nr:DUF3016 domain-containing protein [Paracoccus laeviglucosivorans]SMO87208.1 Protein of unknown function [Paracoccus laeviglucosivorans]
MFRTVCQATCASLLCAMLATPAMADVVVDYAGLAGSRDPGLRSDRDRRIVVAQLDRSIQELGQRYLQPGQDLRIDIVELDLAGDFEPWRSGMQDVRIMRDVTPPKIRIRYALTQNGQPIQSGEARLGDMNYLSDPRAMNDSEPLIHEKLLLRDWFKKTFG